MKMDLLRRKAMYFSFSFGKELKSVFALLFYVMGKAAFVNNIPHVHKSAVRVILRTCNGQIDAGKPVPHGVLDMDLISRAAIMVYLTMMMVPRWNSQGFHLFKKFFSIEPKI
jgi:hypothetical protein